MFPKNTWYVAAYAHEVTGQEPFGCKVAGLDLVLFRNGNGTVVAMEDRCAHRFAPLSLGRVENGDIRCMYHGIKFGPDGACKEIPGQDQVPKTFCVQTYIVRERFQWVWLWLGEPEGCDESLIPETIGQDPQFFDIEQGSMEYEANYQLVNDNLCDLSHVAFVHENTIGKMTGQEGWANSRPVIEYLPRGVRTSRWFAGQSVAEKFGAPDNKVDFWVTNDYLLPGVLLMESQVHVAGTAEKLGFEPPVGNEALSTVRNTQAVTPKDEKTLRYVYSVCVPHGDPTYGLHGNFANAGVAFAEDKRMIEAQQKVIDKNPDLHLAATSHDKAALYFRKLIRKAS